MREILFRGKRLDNGEWVYGSRYGNNIIPASDVYDAGFTPVRVAPKTIGQFTGLTDKNGKKIFEGDIMRNAGNIVEFYIDGFCINGDSPLVYWTNTEIIGNIYDNPELVK